MEDNTKYTGKSMNKNIKIMDVTLRDGSYANHFQFSLAQQKLITTKLEE